MARQAILVVALVFLAVVGAYATGDKPSSASASAPSASPASSPTSGSGSSASSALGSSDSPPALTVPAPAPSAAASLKASGVVGVATGVAGLFFFFF